MLNYALGTNPAPRHGLTHLAVGGVASLLQGPQTKKKESGAWIGASVGNVNLTCQQVAIVTAALIEQAE